MRKDTNNTSYFKALIWVLDGVLLDPISNFDETPNSDCDSVCSDETKAIAYHRTDSRTKKIILLVSLYFVQNALLHFHLLYVYVSFSCIRICNDALQPLNEIQYIFDICIGFGILSFPAATDYRLQ